MEQDKDLIISGLMESVEILRTENDALRNSNRILRIVFRQLRAANDDLRRIVDVARNNDELFKSYCQKDFDVPVFASAEGGLPDATGTVEPLG